MDTTPTPTTHPGSASVTGPTPDLTSYRAIHQALRDSTGRLAAAIGEAPESDRHRGRALARWFHGLSGELQAHHRIEDTIFFPALAARVPSYADYAATLDADHHRLDELIDLIRVDLDRMADDPSDANRGRADATAHAAELHLLMVDHLAFEDADVLPMFERHFSADEYDALDRQAIKAVTLRQALFTVPWFMATTSPDMATHTLETAPLPLRIVERLTRGRYARLTAAAFGTSAAPSVRSEVRP